MNISLNEKLFDKYFRNLFPEISLNSFRYGDKNEVNYSHYLLPTENEKLMRSQYYYGGSSNLCHFTSIEAAINIVESGIIRLYNLHSLNDPREFSYAAKVMKLSDDEKLEARASFFILSLCEKQIFEKRSSKQFNLWRLYGKDGYGCAIEFSFSENGPKNWKNYYLSPLIYGSQERDKLKKIYTILNRINKIEKVIGVDLNPLLCFHKSLLYKDEQEVRLLFDYRLNKGISTTIFSDRHNKKISPITRADLLRTTSVEKLVKYLELPLYRKNMNSISDEIPLPKVEKIVVGYRNKDNFDLISQELKERFGEKLGYNIKIELSNLTSIFW